MAGSIRTPFWMRDRERDAMDSSVSDARPSSSVKRIDKCIDHFGMPWPLFNDGVVYEDVVKSRDSGSSMIEFYSSKYMDSAPKEGWFQRIQNGQIKIDGQVVTDPDTTLSVGSKMHYQRVPWKEPDAPYMQEILFEDDDMLVINKPSGLQVLPGGLFQHRTVLTQLLWRTYGPSLIGFEEKHSEQVKHPVPVHRLGRGTSGVLLCAKTKVAKVLLSGYFSDGASSLANKCLGHDNVMKKRISKTYRGLATGIIEKDEVTINQGIGRMKYTGVAKGLYVASSSGKPSESKLKVLERNLDKNCTLFQVEISSGRPHQIRIHLSFIGHPLVGDPLYGIGGVPKCSIHESRDEGIASDGGYCRPSAPIPGDCGYHLHAHHLIFPHPTTNKVLKITAPLPVLLRARQENA